VFQETHSIPELDWQSVWGVGLTLPKMPSSLMLCRSCV